MGVVVWDVEVDRGHGWVWVGGWVSTSGVHAICLGDVVYACDGKVEGRRAGRFLNEMRSLNSDSDDDSDDGDDVGGYVYIVAMYVWVCQLVRNRFFRDGIGYLYRNGRSAGTDLVNASRLDVIGLYAQAMTLCATGKVMTSGMDMEVRRAKEW